jgi:RNA polymerase sigma factor (sigma-70 family)
MTMDDIQRVAAFVMYSGASQADAEDATQDALCELYSMLVRGDEPRNPQAWSRVVARRAASRYAAHRHRERPTSHEDLASFAGPAGGHDEIAGHLAEHDQVLDWIRSLPPNHRDVIALTMDGCSTFDIADRLQLPIGIVRIRLAAARRKLREAFVAQMATDRQAERTEQRTMAFRSRSSVQRARLTEIPTAEESTDQRELSDLPPRQQQVLRLSRRGYKPAQIAQVLGLSSNTVRVNLFHARKRMRQNLELLGSEKGRLSA